MQRDYFMKSIKLIVCLIILALFSCNSKDQLIVGYYVTSSELNSNADISYRIGDKSVTLDDQELPWEYKFKLFTTSTSKECFYLELAGSRTDVSTLTIKISYDDEDRFVETFSDDIVHTISDIQCLYAAEDF